MWQRSNILCLLLVSIIFTTTCFAKSQKIYNPIWADSILQHHEDSAALAKLANKVWYDTYSKQQPLWQLQPEKANQFSVDYFLVLCGLLFAMGILFVFFSDFFHTMFVSIVDTKKYSEYFQSNKFDNLILIITVFIINAVLSSLIIVVLDSLKRQQTFFKLNYFDFFKYSIVVLLFMTTKAIIELSVTNLIQQYKSFKFYFIIQLFIENVFLLLLAISLIISIYNEYNHIYYFLIISTVIYLVINIIKGYQLFGYLRITQLLHFFTYICALKILPFILLGKYFLEKYL